MRKFNTKNIKGKWITHPEDKEVQVRIRPFSLFSFTKIPTEENVDMSQFWGIFNYCVLDWKGFVDSNDKPMKCTEENKRIVFDYDQDIILFVVNEASEMRESVVSEKEVKNLSTSQPGETAKQEK